METNSRVPAEREHAPPAESASGHDFVNTTPELQVIRPCAESLTAAPR